MKQTGHIREPYFQQLPNLRQYERLLFRSLFMQTVYGLDATSALLELVGDKNLLGTYTALLQDGSALAFTSSFGINYLYLVDRLVRKEEISFNVEQLAQTVDQHLSVQNPLERQLYCYFLTHSIIGESLFYSRVIPSQKRAVYMPLIARLDTVIRDHVSSLKLDILYEYLVCCRLLAYDSPHFSAIINRTVVGPGGYILEPSQDAARQTLINSEHRNVLFLMSQRPFARDY
jgi:hypothetical protein